MGRVLERPRGLQTWRGPSSPRSAAEWSVMTGEQDQHRQPAGQHINRLGPHLISQLLLSMNVPGRYRGSGRACCSGSLPACPPSDTHHSSASQTGSSTLGPGLGPDNRKTKHKIIHHWERWHIRKLQLKWPSTDLAELLQLFVGVWVQFLGYVFHPEQSSSVLCARFLHPSDCQQRVCDGTSPECLHLLVQTLQWWAKCHPLKKKWNK